MKTIHGFHSGHSLSLAVGKQTLVQISFPADLSPCGHRDAMSNFIPDEIVTKSPGRLHGCRWLTMSGTYCRAILNSEAGPEGVKYDV
jgi:hypothetical protein